MRQPEFRLASMTCRRFITEVLRLEKVGLSCFKCARECLLLIQIRAFTLRLRRHWPARDMRALSAILPASNFRAMRIYSHTLPVMAAFYFCANAHSAN